MLAVRTPGAPLTARVVAACGSAFPFERQGRLLRSRSISGLFSRSLNSGLQPPCLRFATAVKLSRLPCTVAGSTLRVLDGYGLRGKWPARPTPAPCTRCLSIDSHVCCTLPSDLASRRQPPEVAVGFRHFRLSPQERTSASALDASVSCQKRPLNRI